MRLQFEEAIHHLHAGTFEIARPADVGLFVESRLDLDQRRHRLAGFRRFHQRAHDRGIARGAIQRLLDRYHVRIARRLLQELHDDVEGFIRVMDDQIFLSDRREDVAAMIAYPLGMPRHVRHEFEIRTIEPRQLRQFVHR